MSASTRKQHVIEDVEWIIGTDHPDNVARRLGYRSSKCLADQVKLWGRPDLADRLRTGGTP